MLPVLGVLILGLGEYLCPAGALCSSGAHSSSATLTLTATLVSAKELAVNVIPQGQGMNEVVASLLVVGVPDPVNETLDYGVIGEGQITVAEVDGHLSIEVPDTMIAFDLRAHDFAVVTR